MGSLDRYRCPRCGLGFVSGDNSVAWRASMLSVWCAFCYTVHDFSFGFEPPADWPEPKLSDITPQQRVAVKCLKPGHRPYLRWNSRNGCPNCGAQMESELLLDFD